MAFLLYINQLTTATMTNADLAQGTHQWMILLAELLLIQVRA